MRKFNKNIILFVTCFVFIISGLLTSTVIKPIGSGLIGFVTGQYNVEQAKNLIDNSVEKGLTYHNQLIDLNGIKEKILGTRVIKKNNIIVKTESESLAVVNDLIPDNEVEHNVIQIEKLKTVTEKNGGQFLYCFAPGKEMYETFPKNVKDYSWENYYTLIEKIKSRKIPYLDFVETIKENNISKENIFFFTDHHWKPKVGFLAATAICESLNSYYGFEYNLKLTDISNYNVKTYHNWFLGSYGKKVGKNYARQYVDDFDLITPKFKTNLTESQPFKNKVREGNFENTVLYMENLKKGYYDISAYDTYSGGDYRLQIMKNNLKPEGKKILLIRDSFACTVAPFLSLQTSELHACDVRNFEYYVGDKLNVEEYIKKINPDYVVLLYSGVSGAENSDGKYDFF